MPQNEFWGSNPEAGKAELGCNYFPLFLSLFPFAFDGAHHIVNGSARKAASWMLRSIGVGSLPVAFPYATYLDIGIGNNKRSETLH